MARALMTENAIDKLVREHREQTKSLPAALGHKERAHSKFSASGAERWFNCSGSVALSEGIKSKDSVWSVEGTKAHEVLETVMRAAITVGGESVSLTAVTDRSVPWMMKVHSVEAANVILAKHASLPGSEIMVETRIYLSFIHPEMFGTFDGAVVDHFGTLHVYDYKYGQGVFVSPKENLQMIFYGIGLAHKFDWNFKTIRLWIIQPRVKGYNGPLFWDLTIREAKGYVSMFEQAVARVLKNPDHYVEGDWCHWCPAKTRCPLKVGKRNQKALAAFDPV